MWFEFTTLALTTTCLPPCNWGQLSPSTLSRISGVARADHRTHIGQGQTNRTFPAGFDHINDISSSFRNA